MFTTFAYVCGLWVVCLILVPGSCGCIGLLCFAVVGCGGVLLCYVG